MSNHQNNLIRDLGVVIPSILIAIVLAETGALESIITSTQEVRFIGSFIAGMFFTSVFTTAPATVALGEIAQSNSAILVAIIGGFGALVGDLIIFYFVRDRVSEDFSYLVKIAKSKKIVTVLRFKMFRWLIPFIGALIVASPLPDEIGVTMMGLAKLKTSWFIPLSFFLNSVGILIIGLIAKSL